MTNVMGILVIVYMVLGLVIYHTVYGIWYFNLTKAFISELFGAFIFGALMTALTLKFWLIATIVILFIGLGVVAKCNNPTIKIIMLSVFVIGAVFIASAGIRYNKQEEENKKAEEFTELINKNSLFVALSQGASDFVWRDRTYIMHRGDSLIYMNACQGYYDGKENKEHTYKLKFLKIENKEMNDNVIEEIFTSSKENALEFVNNRDENSFFVLDDTRENVEIIMPSDMNEYSGVYTVITEKEAEDFYEMVNKYEYGNEGENEIYQDSDYDTYSYTYDDVNDSTINNEDDDNLISDTVVSESTIYYSQFTNSYIDVLFYPKAAADGSMGEIKVYEDNMCIDSGFFYLDNSGESDWYDYGYSELFVFRSKDAFYYLGVRDYERNTIDFNSAWKNKDTYYRGADAEIIESVSDDFILANSQFSILTEDELIGFNKEQCRIARNEIYARHGKVFNSQDLKDYFGSKSWYVENEDFDDSWLSDIEKYNIEIIVAYEEKCGYR